MIKTKAGVTVEELGEQYCLLGPYNEACVRTEVEVMEPYNEAMRDALQQMRDHGIKVSSQRDPGDILMTGKIMKQAIEYFYFVVSHSVIFEMTNLLACISQSVSA